MKSNSCKHNVKHSTSAVQCLTREKLAPVPPRPKLRIQIRSHRSCPCASRPVMGVTMSRGMPRGHVTYGVGVTMSRDITRGHVQIRTFFFFFDSNIPFFFAFMSLLCHYESHLHHHHHYHPGGACAQLVRAVFRRGVLVGGRAYYGRAPAAVPIAGRHCR